MFLLFNFVSAALKPLTFPPWPRHFYFTNSCNEFTLGMTSQGLLRTTSFRPLATVAKWYPSYQIIEMCHLMRQCVRSCSWQKYVTAVHLIAAWPLRGRLVRPWFLTLLENSLVFVSFWFWFIARYSITLLLLIEN